MIGIAALVVVNQMAVDRTVSGDSSRGLTTLGAVLGFLVVAFVARLVPLGEHPLRRDVGRRFGAAIYLSALAAALVAVLVGDILLTGFCVVGLALLAGLVVTRRVPAHDETS
ncbi:hypothetical protein ASG28_12205 [Frigoribacterium sp. Leaf415]|nr:hypothetical protein ASF07_12195 [Frigoribacterium sp. Leaf254]KQT40207.1 hypothetical protein ASG28_12205 [Frigoribacterium sp. Leaf415]